MSYRWLAAASCIRTVPLSPCCVIKSPAWEEVALLLIQGSASSSDKLFLVPVAAERYVAVDVVGVILFLGVVLFWFVVEVVLCYRVARRCLRRRRRRNSLSSTFLLSWASPSPRGVSVCLAEAAGSHKFLPKLPESS